jgi:hypothetical protein
MFKKLSTLLAKYALSNEKFCLFMISAALLAVPLTSSQAQGVVISATPPCDRGLNNRAVRCEVSARCKMSANLYSLLDAWVRTDKFCPFNVVYNYAYAGKSANLTGVVFGGSSQLGSGGGPMMEYSYFTFSCAGIKHNTQDVIRTCPEPSGGAGGYIAENSIQFPMPTTQSECRAYGWNWDSSSFMCEPVTAEQRCSNNGGSFNFSSGECEPGGGGNSCVNSGEACITGLGCCDGLCGSNNICGYGEVPSSSCPVLIDVL